MQDIMDRFGFLTAESVSCWVSYSNRLDNMSSPNQADGTLIQRAIQLSYDDIETILPNQLATRTMAAYNVNNNFTCSSYISQVAATPIQTQFICDIYDFDQALVGIQGFVNATWYGDFYKASFMNNTGLNETQYDSLFNNVSDAASFGGVLAAINQNVSTHYNCTDGDLVPDNCTSTQLAAKQWGSSVCTLDPVIPNEMYTKDSISMANWGNFKIEALPQAPEYAFYVTITHPTNGTNPVLLNETQVTDMFAYDYTWYGLNNTYTAKLFAQVNQYAPSAWSGNQTAFVDGMSAQYGLNTTEVLLVYDTFTQMATYITGGSTQVFQNRDLILGFYSTMANKICNPFTASTIKGDAIYYEPIVTPSITNYLGPLSQQSLTVFTGKSIPDGTGNFTEQPAGKIVAQNGVDKPNKVFIVYNGLELITTYEFLEEDSQTFHDFEAFDGQQNAPIFSGDITN